MKYATLALALSMTPAGAQMFVNFGALMTWTAPAYADTIITGEVCSNTCFGFGVQDNVPDYLGLFGPAFAELVGPFTLDIGASNYSLTINGNTIVFGLNDPTRQIVFNSPLLASFAPGAFEFIATGNNPFGVATAESEFLCPTPAVPEPATWVLLLVGLAGSKGFVAWKRSTGRRRRG
jgi:hypothetical protein